MEGLTWAGPGRPPGPDEGRAYDGARSGLEWGIVLRDEALERLTRRTDPAWLRAALHVARQVAQERREFTADDVRDALVRHGVPEPDHPRRMAVVMSRLRRAGVARATDRVRTSTRAVRHAGTVRVWESLARGRP